MNSIETLSGRELAAQLDDVAARVADDAGGNERLIVEHRGCRFAVVSIDDLEYLEHIDQQLDDSMAEKLRASANDPDRQQTTPFDVHAQGTP